MSTILRNVFRLFGGGDENAVIVSGAKSKDIKFLTHQQTRKESTRGEEQHKMGEDQKGPDGPKSARFLGSLKDALAAAGRDETGGAHADGASEKKPDAKHEAAAQPPAMPSDTPKAGQTKVAGQSGAGSKSAAEAAAEARAGTTAPDEKAVETMSHPRHML